MLVVDSDQDTRELYRVWLETAGLEVEEARNGQDAFVKARGLRPAVVVTDLMLEASDGFMLAERLRAHDETHHIPIIVVTGYTSPRLHDRMRDLDALAVLLKPCSLDRLLDEVRRAVESAAGTAPVTT